MTENKRFTISDDVFNDGETIIDNESTAEDGGKQIYWTVEYVQLVKLVDLMNELHEENKELKQTNQKLYDDLQETIGYLGLKSGIEKENEQLKKELHLMHMRGMFSTVKSFKGNISKRYTYSEETDNVYDVANHYGQYCKILSKKEMVMLLNEYETVLKELEE